jgi:hypothetical protein
MKALKALTRMRLSLALAASLAGPAGCGAQEGPAPVAGPSPTLSGVDVTFRLDPRISRGIYLGDRWLSPPYLRVGEGEQVTVEARAYALDAAGQPTTIAPTWTPTDPGMVTVTPARGNEVGITVKRGGESRLRITVPGVSMDLIIKATYPNGVIQVEISQAQ